MARGGLKLKGDRQLLRAFRSLEQRTQESFARSAVAAAAGPLTKAIKSAVPERDKFRTAQGGRGGGVREGESLKPLKRSIGRRRRRYRARGVHSEFIGPRFAYVDKQTGERPSARAFAIEFGDENTPAQPFMRRTFDENRSASVRRMRDGLWSKIRQHAQKEGAKARA